MGADSVVDLLFLLGTERDEHSCARVGTMLSWLQETASAALEPHPSSSRNTLFSASDMPASSACIHSVAAVLWRLQTFGAGYDLAVLFTRQLLSDVYQWTLLLPVKSGVKSALDAVLCSMCFIQPDLFPSLLRTIGAVAPSGSTDAPLSDDTKDMEHDQEEPMTDDRKQALDAWSSNMHLSEGQLMTIAMVSQSPPAVERLLGSGLLSFLSKSLLDFCFHEQEQEYVPRKSGHAASILTDDKTEDDDGLTSGVQKQIDIMAFLPLILK